MATIPFTLQRRIAWGECDPARIYYTPRAADYAVEAVEAWYETVLQVSWGDLAEQYNLDAPFLRVDCDLRRPLVASQSIPVRVWVARSGRSSLTFTVVGGSDDDKPYFLVSLMARFVERKSFRPIPIPPEFRQRIETYQSQCGSTNAVWDGGNPSQDFSVQTANAHGRIDAGGFPPPMGKSEIFTRQRRVVYGDCDASGMVYTPRVFDYAVEAIGEWYEEVPGISWMDLVCKREQGAPFVSASCEYLRPMLPGQSVALAVRVTRLGGASIWFAVVGYDPKGEPCFDARLAACFIDKNRFKSMPVPEEFRQRIEAYQAACEAADKREYHEGCGM